MDELKKRKLAHKADKLTEYSNKGFELHNGFVKTILTVSVTVLGVLVALSQSADVYNNYSTSIRTLYSVALSTLSLGIVALTICLYGFVHDYKALVQEYAKQIIDYIEDDRKIVTYVSPKPPKIYVYSECAGYVLLLASVICFTGYLIGLLFT